MKSINKKGSKIFKGINIGIISIYTALMLLMLWNIIDERVINLQLFLIAVYIFNMIFTFKTYAVKYTIPGMFIMVLVSISIIKVLSIKIDVVAFMLVVLLSGLISTIFIKIFYKHYGE